MPTQLEVWNEALTAFLEMPSLASTNLSNESARTLNSQWLNVTRRVLERGDWNFARTRVVLAQTGTNAFGFANKFGLPSDCARVVWVSETGAENEPMLPGRYQIERNAILTDATTVYAIYITYGVIATPGLWAGNFSHIVSAELALACRKLNSESTKLSDAERHIAEKQALSVDAVQNQPRLRKPGSWSTANRRRSRGGAAGGLPEMQS
jgi:hypothetical protein